MLAVLLVQRFLGHYFLHGREVIVWYRKNIGTKLNGPPELLAYGFVLSGTYLLYPLRIIFLDHDGNYQGKPSLSRLRIPAAFDPAPLLYPTIIPVLVALSLAALNPTLLLPNLILSIAAIPRQVIPFYQTFFGYSSIQWFLSTVPVSVFKIWTSILPLNASGTDIFSLDPLSPENLTMLYPLHQALLPSLGYLTTTSLLSAELQLLSVSMINIYLFSKSPQSLILKALLWIGGLSIFVSCRVVLESGVALARVPRWRFRNPRRRSPRRGLAFFLAFNEHMQRFLSKRIFSRVQDTTESEDSQDSTPSITSRMRRAGEQKRKTHRRHGDKGRTSTTMLVSAIDGDTRNEFDISKLWSNRQRSQTLPTYLGTLTNDLHGEEGRLRKKGSQFTLNLSDPRFFMGLTEVQATAVKWLYAFYVYAIVLIIIMIPVRLFVSWNALQSHEPIGWALGYLFGDVPAFRAPVKSLDLGSWIPLPPALEPFSSSQNWIGGFRTLGAANIRLLICLYCITILGLGLRIVFHLTSFVEVDTRRKVFHGMMVVMFLPSILIDPCFCALALILVLATFLLLDLCRASQLPPLSRPLTNFLAPYVDGRDHRGPVIVSHIFLLIGCAIPLWLSLAAAPRTATGNSPWEGWDTPTRDLGMISGVVCVGMGDAAASLFGRRYGRRRWCWSGGKSLEGSLAFTLAVILGLVAAKIWLACCFLSAEGGKEYSSNNWGHGWWSMVIMGGKMTVAAAGASLTEAVLTGGNDNVIVPVILWLLVRGLGI